MSAAVETKTTPDMKSKSMHVVKIYKGKNMNFIQPYISCKLKDRSSEIQLQIQTMIVIRLYKDPFIHLFAKDIHVSHRIHTKVTNTVK